MNDIHSLIHSALFPTFETQGYPPYDLIKVDDNHFTIRVVLNGASKDNIRVLVEKGQLVVSHRPSKDRDVETNYLHKGISTKSFTLRFNIKGTVGKVEANVVDGLLVVDLKLKEDSSDRYVVDIK
jgi:HSP20 family molecular chaperone IbpA